MVSHLEWFVDRLKSQECCSRRKKYVNILAKNGHIFIKDPHFYKKNETCWISTYSQSWRIGPIVLSRLNPNQNHWLLDGWMDYVLFFVIDSYLCLRVDGNRELFDIHQNGMISHLNYKVVMGVFTSKLREILLLVKDMGKH